MTTDTPDVPELADPEHLGTVEVVDYLVGHAPDNEGQNPFGQDHVQDRLEEMDAEALRAVAMEAIWRLANPEPEAPDMRWWRDAQTPSRPRVRAPDPDRVRAALVLDEAHEHTDQDRPESDGEFLARIGTDAEAWATEFLVRFGEAYNIREAMPGTGFGERVPTIPGSDAHHVVTGWFANAIGAGESKVAGKAYAATSIVRMLVAEGWVHVLEDDGGAPVLLAAAVCEPIDLDPLQAALLADLSERKPS